mgnify:CR=1 FL=1|tara:strand:+ start:624 stop:1205 length:582 start_codon:yes stop_codon:yes gene_type:complete
MRDTLLLFLILTFSVSKGQKHIDKEWESGVKDSSAYDINFLKYWGHVNPLIIKDSIIVHNDHDDAILIPTDLPLNKKCLYFSKTNDTTYWLAVKRINYTNIEFLIEGKAEGKLVFSRVGIAILESSYWLGSEGVYETASGDYYGMNDYNFKSKTPGDNMLLIPVGTTAVIEYYETKGNSKVFFHFKRVGKNDN